MLVRDKNYSFFSQPGTLFDQKLDVSVYREWSTALFFVC
jgi:hypothetical protein